MRGWPIRAWHGRRFFNSLQKALEELRGVYHVIRETKVPELGIKGVRLEHARSGATVLHLHKPGERHWAFSVAFRTPPSDSTGVAHILEHTVLCGSARYPVRDPFFKMLNRSLASYMNAWTAADWTMYPFSTQNATDYANLRAVYLDAVFRPRISEMDFCQEGWRLENAQITDRASPLLLKGVVYNEMKGVFSDNESLFSKRQQQAMLPGTCYEHVSGGDPQMIPRLKHADLVAFHRLNYRPENALFVSYGDMDLKEHLISLDDTIGRGRDPTVDPIPPSTTSLAAGLLPWTEPQRVKVTCAPDPLGDPGRQVKAAISFLCNEVTDAQTTFNMQILSALLFDGPASPMYKALIESNLGADYAPGTGYDASTARATLSVGLQGLRLEDIPRMEQLVMDTFVMVRKDGFPQGRIDAILHQIQLGLRYHSSNFGLGLLQKSTAAWVHNNCPLEDLQIDAKVAAFREAFQAGDLFESYLDRFIFGNSHKLHFVMRPSDEHNRRLAEQEEDLIKELSPCFTEAHFQRNKQLEEAQRVRADEGKETLPCLSLQDVPRELPLRNPFLLRPGEQDHLHGFSHPLSLYSRLSDKANGLAYYKALFSLPELDRQELLLLPLLGTCLTDLGVTGRSLDEFDEQVRLYTGGISIGYIDDGEILSLLASSHAQEINLSHMFRLLQEALTRTRWNDHGRLETLVRGMANSLMNELVSSGHALATSWAASTHNAQRERKELMGGLAQVRFINELVTEWCEDQAARLANKLKSLAAKIFSRTSVPWRVAVVGGSQETLDILEGGARDLCVSISQTYPESVQTMSPPLLASNPGQRPDQNAALVLPFTTNFVARAISTKATIIEGPDEAAALALASKLLTTKFLHREVREKGGAYGGGAAFSTLDGLWSFYSYRDPHPVATGDLFSNGLISWIREVSFSEQDLLEAKLAIFSDLDAPCDLAGEGLQHFKYGLTDAHRQRYRDALFATKGTTVRDVATKYLQSDTTVKSTLVALVQDDPMIRADLERRSFKIIPSLSEGEGDLA